MSRRRKKLVNGSVVEHPRLGRLTIKVELRDNVIRCPELWNAYNTAGKQAVPSTYTEGDMHRMLKRYSADRSYRSVTTNK